MEKVYFFLIITSTGLTSFAQKVAGTVRGTVVDSISAIPLDDAFIFLISERDSTVKFFTNSSINGRFNINNVDTGNYIFITPYSSLEPVKKLISVSNEKSTSKILVLTNRIPFPILFFYL